MRRLGLSLSLAGLLVGPAHAGSYTFTTTAGSDAVLTFILTKVNAERAAANLPPIPDVQTYLDLLLTNSLQDWARQAHEARQKAACAAYQGLTPEQQDGIKAQLGGNDPC